MKFWELVGLGTRNN